MRQRPHSTSTVVSPQARQSNKIPPCPEHDGLGLPGFLHTNPFARVPTLTQALDQDGVEWLQSHSLARIGAMMLFASLCARCPDLSWEAAMLHVAAHEGGKPDQRVLASLRNDLVAAAKAFAEKVA